MTHDEPSSRALTSWAIWRNRPGVSAFLIAVDVAVFVWMALDVAFTSTSPRDWAVACLLVAVAVVFEEGATRVARLEWRVRSELKRDMISVWSVGAAVALPAFPAAASVIGIYGYVWWRQRGPKGQLPYRAVYSGASVVAGCLAAGYGSRAVMDFWSGTSWGIGVSLATIGAIAAFAVVNRGLITVGLLAFGASFRELIGSVEDNLTELSTLCLGGLLAVAALHEPGLCVLVILPMAMLQRGSFVRELETAAITDPKTGMLNAIGWERIAERELVRARRKAYPVSILIFDMDHFKNVNDRHGHIVGDQVLRGLGRILGTAMREYDRVARFGGEEFVAVLPSTDELAALEIADRIRVRVNAVTLASVSDVDDLSVLSVSVGVASVHPAQLIDTDLTAMLVAADRALYRAKESGRNRVCLAIADDDNSGGDNTDGDNTDGDNTGGDDDANVEDTDDNPSMRQTA